jgi:RES domain-containing protein
VFLWRVSNYANLLGAGGKRSSARWHTTGEPIVYLAENPALALLEHLVNLELDPRDVPTTYQLLKVEAPDTIQLRAIGADELERQHPGWRLDLALTRSLGDDWLAARETPLCAVPSAVLPESTNFILNPLHTDAATLRIIGIRRPAYDPRLFRSR